MRDEAGAAVTVRDLVKEFDRGRLRALAGVDLHVDPGELVAVTGPSGSGKSTLLHLVAALDRPTSGSIVVGGRDLDRRRGLDRYRRTEVGIVFQFHDLLSHLSAAQNVEIAMMGTHTRPRRQRERALVLLEEVDLAHRATSRPGELSGGERQRVAIARALANDPAILLADEPTGSLDPVAADRFLRLLLRLRDDRGLTVLLVTHDRAVADVADRVVVLRGGRVVTADEADATLRARSTASSAS